MSKIAIIHKTFAANSILTSADFNKYVMNQAVVGVDTVAELDTLPTAVRVAFCFATQLVYQRGAGNAWGTVVKSPRPIDGTFSADATSSATTIEMATLSVPDPGFPYMINLIANSESGAVAAGTRYDSQVFALNGGVDTFMAYAVHREAASWVQLKTGGPVLKSATTPFTGTTLLRYRITRVYGSGTGTFTPYNQLFRAWVHPA